jgi:hypothetical protein
MSDGHSEAARYSKFYKADMADKLRREQRKLEQTCIVLKDGTVISLDGVKLLSSEKYDKNITQTYEDVLLGVGSKDMNLKSLISEMIRKGIV